MNCVTLFAMRDGRDYITPEDVGQALSHYGKTRVRLDVLAVLGKQTDFGAEDAPLCAFVAWKGEPHVEEEESKDDP